MKVEKWRNFCFLFFYKKFTEMSCSKKLKNKNYETNKKIKNGNCKFFQKRANNIFVKTVKILNRQI